MFTVRRRGRALAKPIACRNCRDGFCFRPSLVKLLRTKPLNPPYEADPVIASDKREAFAQGRQRDEAIQSSHGSELLRCARKDSFLARLLWMSSQDEHWRHDRMPRLLERPRFLLWMAGLVPAIHVLATEKGRRGS